MRKIRSGQSFLYRSNGYNSTVIEIRMKERVEGSVLQEALRQTSMRFPYLTDKLVEKDGNYYLCEDKNSMVAVPTRKFRRLGSMATGYHLLDVTYEKEVVRVAFHHGLCDGRGVKPFVETLLFYYASIRKHQKFLSENIRLAGEKIDPKEYEEPFDTEFFDVQESEKTESTPARGYRLPETKTADYPCYKTEYILDEERFVQRAKEIGATPGILLSLIISDCIQKCEPEHEADIVCNMAMDLRGAIGKDLTHCNCVGSTPLSYTKEMNPGEWEEIAKIYRQHISAQKDENTVKRTLNKQIGLFNKLDSLQSLEEKKQMMSFFESMTGDTYVISYLGKLILNDYAEMVDHVSFYNDSIGGMTVNMISAAGKLTVTVLQSFSEDRYIRMFTSTLQKYGLLQISETREVLTGQDKSHLTAGRQGERFFIR